MIGTDGDGLAEIAGYPGRCGNGLGILPRPTNQTVDRDPLGQVIAVLVRTIGGAATYGDHSPICGNNSTEALIQGGSGVAFFNRFTSDRRPSKIVDGIDSSKPALAIRMRQANDQPIVCHSHGPTELRSSEVVDAIGLDVLELLSVRDLERTANREEKK